MVYISRINRHLKLWKDAWIKHPLRSEHNLTPEQLWTYGYKELLDQVVLLLMNYLKILMM